jgi:PAS domain S-box-containing protein
MDCVRVFLPIMLPTRNLVEILDQMADLALKLAELANYSESAALAYAVRTAQQLSGSDRASIYESGDNSRVLATTNLEWSQPTLATLEVPIIRRGLPWAYLAVQMARPHTWQDWEAGILRTLASQLSSVLYKSGHHSPEQHLQRLQGAAIQACADVIMITDHTGMIIWVNPAFTQLTGYAMAEAIGRNPRELVKSNRQDREFYRNLWQTILAGQVWRGELVNRRKDGSLYTEAMTITPVRDQMGSITNFVAVKRDISDRKFLEAQLREREAFFGSIFAKSIAGITTANQNGRFLQVNQRFCDLVGYGEEELRQMTFMDLTHPEDRFDTAQYLLHLNTDPKVSFNADKRYIHKSGRVQWAHVSSSPVYDSDGKFQYILTVAVDVSDRKAVEAQIQLQSSKERLIYEISQHIRQSLDLDFILNTTVREVRHFLQTDRVLIYRLDADWHGQVVNESVVSDSLSVIDRRIIDVCFTKEHGQSFQQGQPRIVADVDKAGLTECYLDFLRDIHVRAKLVVPILQGEKLWGLLIAHHCCAPRDWQTLEVELLQQLATQLAIAIQQLELYQKLQLLNTNLEQQVKERTAQLQQTVEFEAILRRITDKVRNSLDEQQILQTVVEELVDNLNLQGCDTGIYNPEQTTSTIICEKLRGLSPSRGRIIILSNTKHLAIHTRLLQGETCYFCDLTPNLIHHQDKCLTTLACPIQDDQRVLGDIWLFKESCESFNNYEIRLVEQVANQCAIALRQSRLYQAAQTQVRELERLNHLKDDFLKTITHELRTPISSIQMASEVLSLDTSQPEPYCHIIKTECQRELQLINDLLDLNQLENQAPHFDLVTEDIRTLVTYLVEPIKANCQQKQQQLILELPPEPVFTTTNLTYLERIITELLENAHKYSPPQAQIRLTIGQTEGWMLMQVTNTGVEIPATEYDRIFDKFYRIPSADPWQHPGTGLGLALVKKMSDALGATIQVNSGLGKTSFSFYLPNQCSYGSVIAHSQL